MSDRACSEIIGILFQCSQCLVRTCKNQRKAWSPATTAAARQKPTEPNTNSSNQNTPRRDLAASLLSYINTQLTTARFQGIRLNALTIVTNTLSIRQLRRLQNISNSIRISSTAIGHWTLRVNNTFTINLIHSQLRRVAQRLKADLALTLEKVSKQIVLQGTRDAANAKRLTDLYLLRAYFGTELWLHERGVKAGGGKREWFEIAALSFVEPYIAVCHQAREAARVGRRLGVERGEAEMALVNEVLLQVVSPFAGVGT